MLPGVFAWELGFLLYTVVGFGFFRWIVISIQNIALTTTQLRRAVRTRTYAVLSDVHITESTRGFYSRPPPLAPPLDRPLPVRSINRAVVRAPPPMLGRACRHSRSATPSPVRPLARPLIVRSLRNINSWRPWAAFVDRPPSPARSLARSPRRRRPVDH